MSEDTDGILNPDEPEVAHRDPVLDAFDRWRAQQDLPAWNDLRAALGPAEAEVDDLELAYRALAESSPETREKAVKKLRDLVAASDVEALKPITAVPWDQVEGEAPERLVWLTGRSGALISAGEVTLLAGAGLGSQPWLVSLPLTWRPSRPMPTHSTRWTTPYSTTLAAPS